MPIFDRMDDLQHEQVVFCQDPDLGLKTIIAVHDTTLGPALGGCRMWNYPDEQEALVDVLRLSRGMTFKASLAGLDLGGGKSVILANGHPKSERFFRRYGEFVESLGGRYISAEDIGTTVDDMNWVAQSTRYVTGTSPDRGGSGDPSPYTALGTFAGIRACVRMVLDREEPKGLRAAVQGAGSVGMEVCRLLHEAGVRLTVSDLSPERLAIARKRFGADEAPPERIYDVESDLFVPCAFGAILNDRTIPRLKCRIVAGSANNQLAEERHGLALAERGILYAPDYAINSGGLVNVYREISGWSEERVVAHTQGIYNTLLNIFFLARKERILPHEAADRLALERIGSARSRRTSRHPQQRKPS
jgi:leucine dehydrogenase